MEKFKRENALSTTYIVQGTRQRDVEKFSSRNIERCMVIRIQKLRKCNIEIRTRYGCT